MTLDAALAGAAAKMSEASGKPCPSWVFANDGDYAYGRFLLDERSQQYVEKNLETIGEPFRRALVWGALWDGVRELRLPPERFIRLALRTFRGETDEAIIQSVTARVAGAFTRYLSPPQRARLAADLEATLEDRMQHAPDLSARIAFYRAFRSVATTPAGLERLKRILAGKYAVPGLEIKPIDRWTMISELLAQGDPEGEPIFEAEQSSDKSGEGKKYAYVVGAARPDATAKARYFKGYLDDPSIQEDWVEQSLPMFNFWNEAQLTRPYLTRALDSLPRIKRERRIFFVLAWLNAFIGGQNSEDAATEVRRWLREHPPEPDLARKVLEVVDEVERTARIRSRFAE